MLDMLDSKTSMSILAV